MPEKRLYIDTTDGDKVQYCSTIVNCFTEDGKRNFEFTDGTPYSFGRGEFRVMSGSGHVDIPTATVHGLSYNNDGEFVTTDRKLPYNGDRDTRELVLTRHMRDIDYESTQKLVVAEIPESLVDRE